MDDICVAIKARSVKFAGNIFVLDSCQYILKISFKNIDRPLRYLNSKNSHYLGNTVYIP